MSYTKGPWVVKEQILGTFICDNRNYTIAGPVSNNPNCEANARLIAAAPELLEAANDYLEATRYLEEPYDSEAAEILRAAIAKATGGKDV